MRVPAELANLGREHRSLLRGRDRRGYRRDDGGRGDRRAAAARARGQQPLGQPIPAFTADSEAERLVDHGPVGPRLLAVAEARGAAMIVLGTRGKRWQSVARYVAKRATCPVMIVGPAADPEGEAVTRPAFDRASCAARPYPW